VRRIIVGILKHAALIPFSLLFLLPLVWMISTSFKSDRQVLVFPPVWIPNPIEWSNYPEALTGLVPFLLYTKNTVTICVFSVLGALLSNTVIAYGFSRLHWPGRDMLFLAVLGTMMMPYQVTMIPLFLVFNRLGWINTFRPLTVPAFFGNAFFIFLLRQFMMGIPRDLTDAAYIDGASDIQQLARIIIPLCKPVLATVTLFQFLWSWNDFLGPLIYLNEARRYTIAVGLAMFEGGYGLTRIAQLMAASTVTTLPIVIIYFFTQRTFIQGIALTGLKG